ncbi:MAG TPA: ABC transporter permease [Dehalococcoidia bacterium]|nr:ABC transporter permease [Dehalococcoidia bacterium]
MSEIGKLGIVTRYEFLKHLRRKRLYVILGITLIAELAVLIILPLLMDGYPENPLVMAAMLTVGPGLATIGAVFFAGDAIAGEFENKTGFILFTNPVRRTTLITGKYMASCIAVIILIVFGYAIMCISLLAIYGEIPVETAKSFGLCLLFGGSVLSVTFFFSAISKGAMGATVITLVTIMVVFGIVESVLMMAGEPYWFLLSAGGDSVTIVFGGMELIMEGLVPSGGMGGMFPFDYEPLEIDLAAYSMVGYLVIGFLLSLWISKRRQLA